MAESVMLDKAKDFAVDIVNLCRSIKETKKEAVLTNQLLRAGTSIFPMKLCRRTVLRFQLPFIQPTRCLKSVELFRNAQLWQALAEMHRELV